MLMPSASGKYGVPYKTFQLEASQGKRDISALHEIDEDTRKAKGGLVGSTHGVGRVLPFP